MTILAALAAPSGIVAAFKARQTFISMSDAQLRAKSGVTAEQWATFESALAAVDADVFRRLASALGLYVAVNEAPRPADNIGATFGASSNALHGELE